jgi:pimeloyl-ACP methyl ester carboxylesterase
MLASTIDVPSLIVFGDKGVVSTVVAEELQRLNPRLQAEQILDAGHSVHLDQPERFVAVVEAFIRSIGTVINS